MKYGKEFQHIINESSFPDDWKSSAIEYGQLKKLIKSVVAELSGMGLSPDILHRLLVTEDEGSPSPESKDRIPATSTTNTGPRKEEDEEVLEFEFESDEASPPMDGSSPSTRATRATEVMLDPILDDDEHDRRNSSDGLLSTSPSAGPSSLPNHSIHRKFRIRLLSNGQPAPAAATTPNGVSPKPMSVMDVMAAQNQAESWRSGQALGAGRRPSRVKRARVDSHGGAKAQYVLTGKFPNQADVVSDPDRPIPQLRLHLPLTAEPLTAVSSATTSNDDDIEGDSSDEDEDRSEPFFPLNDYPLSPRPGIPNIDIIPPSPSLSRMRAAKSPIWSLTSGAELLDPDLGTLSLEEPALEPEEIIDIPRPEIPTRSTTPDREFIIPLAADIAFFNLLTAALTSLSTFHAAQQLAFKAAVEKLCLMISQSIQPSSSGSLQVLSTPLTPSPRPAEPESDLVTTRIQRTARASKKDLYAWREIFTLWIESEIFESSAERTRGERTVEQAEGRLKRFADMVVKRGLGDRRTLKGKKVREAWEEFLRLNVLLLDLKRFQIANINAARKILKKHDKRTALTASAGFPDFVRSTLAAHVDKDGNISTWTFYNTSLPHVLLASLTDTLLPILPSLDDYACLICTSIAFKPIRLNCSHLFCVRCLVKMQRAGKAECPLCRSKVVLLADKNSLDMAVMTFMKEWFPKEVKEKQKENEVEIAGEQMGVVNHGQPHDPRCIIM